MPVINDAPDETTHIAETLPVLVLPDLVIFPVAIIPIHIADPAALKLVDDVAMGDKLLGILARKGGEGAETGVEGAFKVGSVARLVQLQRLPDNSQNVAIQAFRRFRVAEFVQEEPYPIARIDLLDVPPDASEEIALLAATVKQQMLHLVDLSPAIPDQAKAILENIDDPGVLADLVAANIGLSLEERQELLETLDRKKRLGRLTHLLARETDFLEASQKIQQNVKNSIDKGQREFFLRQQLKAIQDELGEGEKEQPHINDYRAKIEALGLTEETKKEALRQLNRLSAMNEAAAEYQIIATYLDWIVDLPWNKSTEDSLDIARAQEILNEDHFGLEKVKQRILEYLAVRKLRADASGPILCFVGPPGVGKTSLGQSIARAMNRKFTRISLGGMHDEAEIRGHRTTYVGAQPGRIIQSLRKVESNNPVFMLDEIDKVGSDFRGDPSSALLEVLDPAQNFSFSDHYLNVPFDLSKIMFIATANVLDTIPWALRDRMEIIELSGYTVEEKLQIARKYLVPRQIGENGIPSGKLTFSAGALRRIIDAHTREAGVRQLEREIARVCRGCARHFAEGRRTKKPITAQNLTQYLGKEHFYNEVVERMRVPGVATGMAWTPTGGSILFVEASIMPGKGNLVLTGQLGDVMKESAQTALSYIRSNAKRLNLPSDNFSDKDLHIHVPAGAVPKDGPSAGVTMLTALVSILTGKRVKNRLSMTGEITLRGQVLPVGGVKEKVLAAVRAGIHEIILPDRCRNDLDDIPAAVQKKLHLHFVKRMEEVLDIALGLDS